MRPITGIGKGLVPLLNEVLFVAPLYVECFPDSWHSGLTSRKHCVFHTG